MPRQARLFVRATCFMLPLTATAIAAEPSPEVYLEQLLLCANGLLIRALVRDRWDAPSRLSRRKTSAKFRSPLVRVTIVLAMAASASM